MVVSMVGVMTVEERATAREVEMEWARETAARVEARMAAEVMESDRSHTSRGTLSARMCIARICHRPAALNTMRHP